VQVEFSPEPTPEEREALLRALGAQNVHREPGRWWEEGVREAVEAEAEN
jgi:hypothetical protein